MIPQYTHIYIVHIIRNERHCPPPVCPFPQTHCRCQKKRGSFIFILLISRCLKACMFYQLLSDQSDQRYSVVSVVVLRYNPGDLWPVQTAENHSLLCGGTTSTQS